jgi:AcrR family transcriptional regulator
MPVDAASTATIVPLESASHTTAPAPPSFFEELDRLPPGRHSVPADEVARQQRQRLLAAMLDAVGEQGYLTTSVADLLGRAGVSRRSFYEQFSDKEDCFLQAHDHITHVAHEAVVETLRDQPSWRDGLRASLDLLLRTAAANPRYARAWLVEVLAIGPEGLRRRDAALAPFEAFLETGRTEAPDGVAIPAAVAETLVGGMIETIATRLMHDDADQLPELLDQLVYWGLVPFVGPAEAASALPLATPAR